MCPWLCHCSKKFQRHWALKQIRDGSLWSALLIVVAVAILNPISWHAVDGLGSQGIKLGENVRYPKAVTNVDLKSAFLIVAMNRSEHHPIVEVRHIEWLERISYWDVSDIDVIGPDFALAKIERLIDALVKTLN